MILNEFYVQILKAVQVTAVTATQEHFRPLVVQQIPTQIVVVLLLIFGSYGLLLRTRIFKYYFDINGL